MNLTTSVRDSYAVSTIGNEFFSMNVKAGIFNGDNISFVDYKHFNGNQTHIGQTDST
jgi:hypothetical protein